MKKRAPQKTTSHLEQDLTIPVIAIDGGAGTGKGTVRRLVAQRLGFINFDSGVLYRALALKAKKIGVPHTEEAVLIELAGTLNVTTEGETIFLDGVDETLTIRSDDIGKLSSVVSKIQGVRDQFHRLQLSMRRHPGLVADGRDMGYIFETPHRFFFVTAPEERARRRVKQFREMNIEADYEAILDEIQRRDYQDTTRTIRPLIPHPQAKIIDTTNDPADVIAEIIIEHYQRSKLDH